MIIQNLHKISKEKRKEKRSSTFLFSFLFLLIPFLLNAQDSIVPQTTITEKTNLDFQEYFFKAITQKAINNYQTAIENLEECNQLIPNTKAVLFELSKNYYLSNKIPQAVEYGVQALQKDPNDLWILELLVAIHQKEKNFDKAIFYQQKIAKNHPNRKKDLVFLHLKKNDIKSAQRVLDELSNAKMLNARLRRIRNNLIKRQSSTKRTTVIATKVVKGSLKEQFAKNKSFSTLKKLLQKLDTENKPELLKYSSEGLILFPAQPLVYLMNGKALNKQKAFKKATESLLNGVDFIIDDNKLEKEFYKQLIKAYEGLGDSKKARKYRKKLTQ